MIIDGLFIQHSVGMQLDRPTGRERGNFDFWKVVLLENGKNDDTHSPPPFDKSTPIPVEFYWHFHVPPIMDWFYEYTFPKYISEYMFEPFL